MPNVPSRRLVAAGASAAMLSAVFATGVGAGVSGAAPAFNDPACKVANADSVNFGRGLATFNVNKKVDGDGEVAADGLVTYTTVVSTGYNVPMGLDSIADVHPAGFTLQKAEVESFHIRPRGQQWVDVTNGAIHAGDRVTFNSGLGGWTLAGQTVTLRTTYKVASDAEVDSEFNSGAEFKPHHSGNQVFNPLNVCVKVKAKKVGSGSLGSLGLGSLSSGTGSIGGSATAPSTDPGGASGGVFAGLIAAGSRA